MHNMVPLSIVHLQEASGTMLAHMLSPYNLAGLANLSADVATHYFISMLFQ